MRPGERLDVAVEIINKQRRDWAGEPVTRLLVADRAGEEFVVLVSPDSDALAEAETGETYKISGLLGAAPVELADDDAPACPDCDGSLRTGQVADAVGAAVAQTAVQLAFDGPFGIVDAETTVRLVPEETDAIDDWMPMGGSRTVETPAYICQSCGRHVSEDELHGGHGDHDEPVVEDAATHESMASQDTVGLAAGGAKDVTNFRENVKNGYTPQPEAISDEGLFYDYCFETGSRSETDALFAPRYAAAVSDHPVTGETEQYLSVGLDSSLSVEEFERPRLDLVAVLDVSGSMDSAFDEYYYDEHGRKHESDRSEATKLAAATRSLCALTEQLRDEDRLGVVLYNHRAHVAKPLRDVERTDMPAIRQHIRDISAGGGTNLADGFEAAVDMLVDRDATAEVERRVVFMTDMMPNTGTTGEAELTELFADAAVHGVHTTFIGMGLDANAELADTLSGIRGANHYFIHSAAEFEQRLGDEFDYMVTPLVYDLDLELDAEGYEIEAVHGSPTAEAATDQLMHVGTLFPSAKQNGEARGGVVLVRMTKTKPEADIKLVASWTERDGGEYTERVTVTMPDSAETFAHDGVRKAVALARYARELRAWARDVHKRDANGTGVDDWLLPDQRGHHERESVPLVVPDEYAARFGQLREYLVAEMEAVEDDALQQEAELLRTLAEQAPAASSEVRD